MLRPEGVDGDLDAIEVVYFSYDLYPDRLMELVHAVNHAPYVKWLHSMSAGVDHPFFGLLRERGVRVTTSSGAHAQPIAHTVLLYVLALSRGLPAWLDAQQRRAWERHELEDLPEKTLGVIGLGPIGTEVARLGRALGMRVIGLRRTPRGDEPCETWPMERLDHLLPLVDYLVIACPLTDETRQLIDARALARLPAGACLVNIARGQIVDEPALIRALETGALRGAALDVFEEEPLPPNSPLWTMPNVIVTPHNSGAAPGNAARATEIFLDNLQRYCLGDPLRNEVP